MPESTPRGVTKLEIVAIALGDCGGATSPVDTEDIAVAAHAMSPESFAWRKYPEHIDLEGVRLKLKNAARISDTRLIEGSVKSGWSLTPAGVTWYRNEADQVRQALGGSTPRSHEGRRAETRKRATERSRVQRLEAWSLWSAERKVSERLAAEVFRVDDYTDARTRTLKVQRTLDLLNDDEDVGEFVQDMAGIVSRGAGNG